jgi:hypothetical protein
MPHVYNPSYTAGRDQEDCGLKPARANSSVRPYLKKPFTKRAGGVAQGIGPEFKPQYRKKKKLYVTLLCLLRCEVFISAFVLSQVSFKSSLRDLFK